MRYIIGVDGGGTKTEAVVCDENGYVVARNIVGSSNPNDIGNDEMIETVSMLIESVLPSDCDTVDVGLGISGIFVAGSETLLESELKARFKKIDKIKALSDKDSAFNCAYDGDGCIMIIGTGSVGFVKKNGLEKNLGGGGYLIDDALSGFDLGRDALNAVLCANDGIGEKTILTEAVFLRTGEDIRKHLKTVYKKGKAYIASFAPLVFEALERGDVVAKRIMQKCVAGFEKLALGVYKAWGEEKCEIILFGGLINKFDVIESFLSEDVKNKITFDIPRRPIIYGLIKYFGKDKNFAERFCSEYARVKREEKIQ